MWLAWIGNGRYDPTGFGPSWRERLDDGLLDVRIVNGARRFSRTRFTVDVLTGRLRRCPVYEETQVESLSIRSLDGPLRLAADGETYDGPDRARGHQAPSGLAGGGAARPGAQQRPAQHHQQPGQHHHADRR